MSQVSVIIPTYNRREYLERAINSVIDQTYNSFEILVVDNNSSDGTADLVGAYRDNRIKLISIKNNGIIARSRNAGIKFSSGEYVAFLDSDDWWSRDKLAISVEYLKAGSDIVYHDLQRYCAATSALLDIQSTRELTTESYSDLLVYGNALNNSSVVVKKNVLDHVGKISEDHAVVSAEDYDFWLRMAASGFKFRRIPFVLGYYQINGDGIASGKDQQDITSFSSLKTVLINHSTVNSAILSPNEKKIINNNISNLRYTIAVWQLNNHQIKGSRTNLMANILSWQVMLKSAIRLIQGFIK